MRFHHRNELEAVAELGIPDVVVLTYGAAMVARGLRLAHPDGDIDFVTTLRGNLYLEHVLGFRAVEQVIGVNDDGSKRTIIARRDSDDQFDSHRWAFSAARHKVTEKGRIYIPELLQLSDQDDETGIYVLNDAGLLWLKADTGRPQDDEDVRRIWQHHDQGY